MQGAKIAIRGKGSNAKEGDVNDPLHVLIQAPNEEAVAKAEAELKILLDPECEAHKESKATTACSTHCADVVGGLQDKGLRELAVLNGTLRDNLRGAQEGPPLPMQHMIHVKCAICGDGSHPTHDCPLRASGMDK